MRQTDTRKRQRATHPLAKLNLRIEVSEEEILADLHYPARARPNDPRRLNR